MAAHSIHQTKQWLKNSNNPIVIRLRRLVKSAITYDIPSPKSISLPAYLLYKVVTSVVSNGLRIFLWTPIFKGRIVSLGKRLYLYGGIPFISGPVEISIGNNCRISGKITISGRSNTKLPPTLCVGNNVDIGWMTTIAVGSRVILGNNVRIAGQAFLAGYPGHPLNPEDRSAGLPDTDNQIGDILLEDDVWLATGVSVMQGVSIGQGTIVAANSVVTKNLPAMVLAGGNPARIIRSL
ncbi:MAG: acetyltransferase [Moraxellaceae bacterium]|nr:MAG: acetyltransferase [Moraxellaceae bacterium]